MSLYSISGFGCYDDKPGYLGGKKRRAVKKAARKAKRTARRAKRKERKTGVNCKGAKVKAVALAPARNAYLALIRVNVKKLAVKLAKATSTPEGKKAIHSKWCKLGGNGAKLQSAIDKAYAKYKRKRGTIGYMHMDEYAAIGAEPVTTATILATAAPIIAALAPLVKQFAGGKAAEVAESVEAAAEVAQEATQEPAESQPTESGGEDVGAIGVNPWLIGAGALAAYFLFIKRK